MTNKKYLTLFDNLNYELGSNQLLAFICHELSAPVHSISGSTKTLINYWQSLTNEDKESSIKNIIDSTKYLKRINNYIQQYELLQGAPMNMNYCEFDLISLCKAVMKAAKSLYEDRPNLQIILESKQNKCLIKTDDFWFKQLLINLVSNAIKFSMKGRIVIRLDELVRDDLPFIRIRVIDDGPGIKKQLLHNIFKPYHKGYKNISGNKLNLSAGFGLGLAIARSIVDAHNGKISAYNNHETDKLSKGATLEVLLPI